MLELARYENRMVALCQTRSDARLVVDCDACTRRDIRLVAKLSPDELSTAIDALLVDYLSSVRRKQRRVFLTDLAVPRFSTERKNVFEILTDSAGRRYMLDVQRQHWLCFPPYEHLGPSASVTVRAVVAALESYKPLDMSEASLTNRSSRLATECRRLRNSVIVLNRGLREAVLRAVEDGVSLSEIAIKCKKLSLKKVSHAPTGDASWVARRVGLKPETGDRLPKPWVHSDVLALIARKGLGLAPHEVEVR